MFQMENRENIGAYIRQLINQKYPSERKFCQAYLRLQGVPVNDEETRKMQNRFSQILNGKKSLQTYDLSYVTNLLDVSCEEILSAGKCFVPLGSHVTNYSVALSNDPKEWQKYIDRKDKLFLNYDEYGKSVLDYAFEFKNYDLLKYLTDKGYIKFHDAADSGFQYDFGAETTIKRRDVVQRDVLQAEIGYSNKLRMNMLDLAMKNKDYSVLDMLRARETPMLHFAALYSNVPKKPEAYDCSRIVESVADAPDEILDYFSSDYSVLKKEAKNPSCFLYQHLGDVIAAMIKNKDRRVISVIEKAVAHNNKVCSLIKDIYADATQNVMKDYGCSGEKTEKLLCKYNAFYDNCGVVRVACLNTKKSLVANVIRADVEVADPEVWRALLALNEAYDNVRHITIEEDNKNVEMVF